MSYAEQLVDQAEAVADIREDGAPAVLRFDAAWGTPGAPSPVDVELYVLLTSKTIRDASGLVTSFMTAMVAAGELGDVPAPPSGDITPGSATAWTLYVGGSGYPDPDVETHAWRVVGCLQTVWSGSVPVVHTLALERVAVSPQQTVSTPQSTGVQNVYASVFPGHAMTGPWPRPFSWSAGLPVLALISSTAEAVGVVVGVDAGNPYRLTIATDGAVVDVAGGHGLGAAGRRWVNSAGAWSSTEPSGLKQVVLEVVSSTRYHVRLGAVYA